MDVTDTLGATTPLTVNLTVGNTAPQPQSDTYTTFEDQPLDVSATTGVLANDTDDYRAGLLAATSTTTFATAQSGTVTLRPDGSFSYTPAVGFTGSDTFTYTPTDSYATAGTTTVSITVVDPVVTPIITRSESYEAHQGEDLVVSEANGLLSNDVGTSGSLTLVTGSVSATHGSIANVSSAGSFTYKPLAGHLGFDTMTYLVTDGNQTVTVNASVAVTNRSPVAVADTFMMVASPDGSDTATLPFAILENDYDADGDTLTLETANGLAFNGSPLTMNKPGEGTFRIEVDQTVRFTPDAGFVGSSSINYTVWDGAQSSTGSIVVQVTNERPQGYGDRYRFHHTETGGASPTPITVSDGLRLTDFDSNHHEYVAVLRDASTGDISSSGTTSTAQGGTVALQPDGSFTYTAPIRFIGNDSFSYAAYDGINDIASSDWRTVAIEVWNNKPVAVPDRFTYQRDFSQSPSALTGTLTDNDVLLNDSGSDPQPNKAFLLQRNAVTGEVNQVQTLTTDNGAQVTVQDDGSFTYTPSAGFQYSDGVGRTKPNSVGEDSFQYVLRDEVEASDPVTVEIDIVNTTPEAADDHVLINQQDDWRVITGDVSVNDFDPEGDDLTFDAVGTFVNGKVQTAYGEVEMTADGSFTYTVTQAFQGTDAFVYRISDGVVRTKSQAFGKVTLQFVGNQVQPSADFFYAQAYGENSTTTPLEKNVGENDWHKQGLTVKYALVSGPQHAEVFSGLSDTGDFVYKPKADFTNVDRFTYRMLHVVEHGGSGESTVLFASEPVEVTIQVLPPQLTTIDDYIDVPLGSTTPLEIKENDLSNGTVVLESLVGASGLGTSIQTQAGGTAKITSNGKVDYQPPAPDSLGQVYIGVDSFSYIASVDGLDASEQNGSVTLFVGGNKINVVNPQPQAVTEGTPLELDAGEFFNNLVVGNVPGAQIEVVQQSYYGSFETDTVDGNAIYRYTVESPLRHNVTDAVTLRVTSSYSSEVRSSRDVRLFFDITALVDLQDDQAATVKGQAVTIDVVANDERATDQAPLPEIVDAPTHGTAEVVNGQIRYTPNDNYVGADALTYKIAGQSSPNQAQVRIEVSDADIHGLEVEDTTIQLNIIDSYSYYDQAYWGGIAGWYSGTFDLSVTDADHPGQINVVKQARVSSQGQHGEGYVYADRHGQLHVSYVLLDSDGDSDTVPQVTSDSFEVELFDETFRRTTTTVAVQIDAPPNATPTTPAPPTYPGTQGDEDATQTASRRNPATWNTPTQSFSVSVHSNNVAVEATRSGNTITLNKLDNSQNASVTVTRTGENQSSLKVVWADATDSDSLSIHNYGDINSLDFDGDLRLNTHDGADLAGNFKGKTLTVNAGADLSGSYEATNGVLRVGAEGDVSGDYKASADVSLGVRYSGEIRDINGVTVDAGGTAVVHGSGDVTATVNADVIQSVHGGKSLSGNYTASSYIGSLTSQGHLRGTYEAELGSIYGVHARSIDADISALLYIDYVTAAQAISGSIDADQIGWIGSSRSIDADISARSIGSVYAEQEH